MPPTDRRWARATPASTSTIASTIVEGMRDDFNDGDFTTNPTWTTNGGSWSVAGGELNQAEAAAVAYLRPTPLNVELSSADRYRPVLDWFASGHRVEVSDHMSDEDYLAALSAVAGLDKVAREFLPEAFAEAPGPAMELVLEGLHQHSMVAKEDVDRGASYSDMMGILMKGMK